ncbi:MAG: hypothetical protein ACTSSF_03470 [Candidatus Heimdallarchaeaceae archaeon]
MSFIKSILKKKLKKEETDKPETFNGLMQFKHKSVIEKSQSSEHPLTGCFHSDTLYFDSDVKINEIGFLFAGNSSCKICSAMQKRQLASQPEFMIIAKRKDYDQFQTKLPFIEVEEKTEEESTFLQGINFYSSNNESIVRTVERTFQNSSLVFIFVDNNSYLMGLLTKIGEFLDNKGVQIVYVVTLPAKNQKIKEEFNALTLIYHFMGKNADFSPPFILIDLEKLYALNSSENYEAIVDTFQKRLGNVFLDLTLLAHTP